MFSGHNLISCYLVVENILSSALTPNIPQKAKQGKIRAVCRVQGAGCIRQTIMSHIVGKNND